MDEGAKVPGQDALLKPEANLTSGNGTSRSRAPRRSKLIRLALAVLVAAVAVTAWLLWDITSEAPPQFVTIPYGQKFQFAGLTYGTTHFVGSIAARLVNRLPLPLANAARKHFGKSLGQFTSFQTTRPTLCLWFKPVGTNAPSSAGNVWPTMTYAKLADENGIEAGTRWQISSLSDTWPWGEIEVMNRRSPMLQLRIYQGNSGFSTVREIGRVRFPNPLYGHFPQWKPEPVPALKKAGDLDVRLEAFRPFVLLRGAQESGYSGPMGKDVETELDAFLSSPTGTNEGWLMQKVSLSDSTGNVLDTVPLVYAATDEKLYGFTPIVRKALPGTLWPDEAAWRLKLEFKRTSRFTPDEIVTLKNVPVPPMGTTNKIPIAKVFGGVKLVLTEFQRKGAGTNASWRGLSFAVMYPFPETLIRLELPDKPEGVAVDFLKVTTDTGERLGLKVNGWEPFRRLGGFTFIPTNAQSVDITLAVQKTRTVEFLVAPPKPK